MMPQPQPQTLQLPTAPADTVEAEICFRLDRLLEEFDHEGGLPPAQMCMQMLHLKTLLLSERQFEIPRQVDGHPVYLLGFVEGVRYLYSLLLPHMTAAEEISAAARLSTTDAAHALHDILL